jgi:hypothetical protein
MSKNPSTYDPEQRAEEKRRSRVADANALASGEKTRDDLRRENGHFAFPNARIRWDLVKSLY